MNRRRADGEPCGCRHPARKAGGAGGSEEIGDGVGAGTGSEVAGVGVVAGVVVGVVVGVEVKVVVRGGVLRSFHHISASAFLWWSIMRHRASSYSMRSSRISVRIRCTVTAGRPCSSSLSGATPRLA